MPPVNQADEEDSEVEVLPESFTVTKGKGKASSVATKPKSKPKPKPKAKPESDDNVEDDAEEGDEDVEEEPIYVKQEPGMKGTRKKAIVTPSVQVEQYSSDVPVTTSSKMLRMCSRLVTADVLSGDGERCR